MTRPNPRAAYEAPPKWRCTLCSYEMDCVAKNKIDTLTAHAGLRRFKLKHKFTNPKCLGEFRYTTGKKKS